MGFVDTASVGHMSEMPALADGLHLIVKHDCPTCVLIEPARDSHPIILDGMQERFGFRSRLVTVRWATRGENEETGRACVSVAFGEGLDDMEVLGLSVPDARRLIEALQHALDAPIAA